MIFALRRRPRAARRPSCSRPAVRLALRLRPHRLRRRLALRLRPPTSAAGSPSASARPDLRRRLVLRRLVLHAFPPTSLRGRDALLPAPPCGHGAPAVPSLVVRRLPKISLYPAQNSLGGWPPLLLSQGGASANPKFKSWAAFNAMFATATAVAIPPAVSYCFPEKLARRRRISWCCRMARVQAGYSQLEVRKVTYRPPGTEQNLLNEINLSLREKRQEYLSWNTCISCSFFIFKTVCVQFWFDIWTEREWKDHPFTGLLAGLSEPTSGSICIQKYDDTGNPIGLSELLTSQRVGIVFQFPERYFLADTVLEEVTFGWPRQKADLLFKEQLALNLQNAFKSVGLTTISLDEDPQSLSGGFKRRLACFGNSIGIVILFGGGGGCGGGGGGGIVQTPDLLLLDEPLAGLDWKARADVVNLLKDLKKHHTILVVSHDLRELYPLVDHSWRMEMGGSLKEEALPV
ncbi:hypothetical protein U9M48_018449 [Paspalum notatum var. saurae]|uniref:ABC transporter domain-containing protein n=1 Tax=Paspalum notatum var. saurae TaxID=547442 RepID=A0AAQ3T9F7_PASNO